MSPRSLYPHFLAIPTRWKDNDVYGHGVNVAARVASLAQPGETLVTDSVRDGMVDGEVVQPGPHQRPVRAQLVIERNRVVVDRRICDEPALRITAAGRNPGADPNHPVQRQPVQALAHHRCPRFPVLSLLRSSN